MDKTRYFTAENVTNIYYSYPRKFNSNNPCSYLSFARFHTKLMLLRENVNKKSKTQNMQLYFSKYLQRINENYSKLMFISTL